VNPREQLRKVLEEKVKPQCRELGVMIETITVAEIEPNAEVKELADQIFIRETTRAARAKNAGLVQQHKSEMEKKANEALEEQKSKLVEANRDLKVANKQAEQRTKVEEAKLQNDLKAATTRLEAAKEQAKATITRGKAEATIINADNEAEVAGLKTAVAGFPTPDHYAQYRVLLKLSPALAEIFASDSSDFAKLFSTYVTPKKESNGKALSDVKK